MSTHGSYDLRRELELADKEDQRIVDEKFAINKVRITLRDAEFASPANYMTPKGKEVPSSIAANFLTFVLFMPDFDGFTRTNWREGWFNRNRIDVIEAGGSNRHRTPERILEVMKPMLAQSPLQDVAGLAGYKRRNPKVGAVTWVGHRQNGELVVLDTTSLPGEPTLPDTYPLCKVQYFRRAKSMFLAYNYSLEHLASWERIDDAIWAKLSEWQVK